MNKSSASNTVPSALPTLGDKPSAGLDSGPAPKKRRFGRKLMFAGIAGLLVVMSATSAYAVTSAFNDTSGNTFEGDINWASAHDVAYGYSDGSFKPNAPVTRGAMTAFIHRYNGEIEKVTGNYTVTNKNAWSETVQCPAGKTPISGGGGTNIIGAVMTDSFFDGANAYHVRWETKTSVNASGLDSVWAMCIPIN